MKKFLIFALSLIVSLSSMTLLACNGQGHTEHDYTTLKFDAKAHWYECTCGEKSQQEDHSGGTATETQKAVCEVCGQEYGNLLTPGHTHNFNKQVTTDTYKKSPATCKGAAVYYYSCECGAKGNETFTSGSIGTHQFQNGKCIHCNESEKPAEKGPISKTQWQALLMTQFTNGKFVMGPIENPGEYTVYESAGNVVRQRVYDNNTLSLELYYEFDGINYYVYQIHPQNSNWIKVKDNSQAQAYMMIQTMLLYGATFYDSYDSFIYDETNNCYTASNLMLKSHIYEGVKITFENGTLKGIKITDIDDDDVERDEGFSIELSNFGTTSLPLPEAELYETP